MVLKAEEVIHNALPFQSTLKGYLALIGKYLRKFINYYKNKGEWKLQLTAEVNFISLKPGSDETGIMHTRSEEVKMKNL